MFGWLIGGFVGYLILPWEKDALNCTMEGLNCTENVSSQLKVLFKTLSNYYNDIRRNIICTSFLFENEYQLGNVTKIITSL